MQGSCKDAVIFYMGSESPAGIRLRLHEDLLRILQGRCGILISSLQGVCWDSMKVLEEVCKVSIRLVVGILLRFCENERRHHPQDSMEIHVMKQSWSLGSDMLLRLP